MKTVSKPPREKERVMSRPALVAAALLFIPPAAAAQAPRELDLRGGRFARARG
jgi:hypothetical protein